MAHKFKHYNTNVCLLTLPKCVAGVPNLLHFPRRPATKRSLYSVFRSPRLLATAVRQFPIPILYLGHSFVHPSLADAAVRVVRSHGSRPGTATATRRQVRPASQPHRTYEQQRTQSALRAVIGRCDGDNLPRPSAGQSTLHLPYLQIDRF